MHLIQLKSLMFEAVKYRAANVYFGILLVSSFISKCFGCLAVTNRWTQGEGWGGYKTGPLVTFLKTYK